MQPIFMRNVQHALYFNQRRFVVFDAHHEAFFRAKPLADKTCHPVPCDTRSWSQILASLLTGINGKAQKGSDLVDGSDVKAACCRGVSTLLGSTAQFRPGGLARPLVRPRI